MTILKFLVDVHAPGRLSFQSRKRYASSVAKLDQFLARPATFNDLADPSTMRKFDEWCRRQCYSAKTIANIVETLAVLHRHYHHRANAGEGVEGV